MVLHYIKVYTHIGNFRFGCFGYSNRICDSATSREMSDFVNSDTEKCSPSKELYQISYSFEFLEVLL
jgi:hypothetical protein